MTLVFLIIGAWILIPIAIGCLHYTPPPWSWNEAPLHATGLAPDPAATPEAVVQVYAARAFGWRGVFAIHPWVVLKRGGDAAYARYEVVGWGGGRKLRVNYALPDGLWYGAIPEVLAEFRGAAADAMIRRIEAAIDAYPFKDAYRTWPGPNSNTFLSHIARNVPEMRLSIPALAIGKDYRPWHKLIDRSPSGTGIQVSALGLAGLTIGLEDGIEINLLGLSFGVDFRPIDLRLPGLGSIRAAVGQRRNAARRNPGYTA